MLDSLLPLLAFAAGLVLGGIAVFFLKPRGNTATAALNARLEGAMEQTRLLAVQHEKSQTELREAHALAAARQAEIQGLQERLAREARQMQEQQAQAKIQFENMANSLLKSHGEALSQHSQKSITEMLNPWKDRFNEFQKRVDEVLVKEQVSLKEHIRLAVEMSQKSMISTDNLSRALKGDVKAQGNWGEVVLERILEDSGLVKGRDYLVQSSGLGLRDEGGAAQRPDIIINLPEGKHVILDAKVSLTDYERYCGAEETGRAVHLAGFIKSLRRHVEGLAARSYQTNDKLNSPDFVLMFLPIEGAFSLAVQHDPELHAYAWNRNVAIVCPSTLFISLRTVASQWRIELQNANTLKIAQEGGALYDKLCGFLDDMGNVEKNLNAAQKSYDEAMKKLSTGNGNVIKRADNMRKLGAKASKALPKELVEESAELSLLEAS